MATEEHRNNNESPMCLRHDRDLYRGDSRKAGLTTRMENVEQWKSDLDSQLNGDYGKPGLIQQMQSYFAVQESRDRSLPWKIAILAIVIPVLYDIGKHVLGVK